MVIGFNKKFVEPILAKTKKHTLREDLHNRWKPGMMMNMATGVRTKNYNQFEKDFCRSVQQIEIPPFSMQKDYIIKVDGRILSVDEMHYLSYNDGFNEFVEFVAWFSKGFKGKIIHWTDLRY